MNNNQILKTRSQIFNISSKNALKYNNGSYKSDLIFQFPNWVKPENVHNAYFSISHAEIPNSFYLISASRANNIFNILENSITLSYTIPDGNYNVKTLISYLVSVLPVRFTISYSDVTLKFTFSNTTYNFSVLSTSTIGSIMGFQDTITSTAFTLTMPFVMNFIPIPRLNVRSNAFNFNSYGARGNTDLILSLQNNALTNSMVLYTNQNNLRFPLNVANIQTVDIRISDDNLNLINLNNCDFFISFVIETEYYELQLPKNINDLLALQN